MRIEPKTFKQSTKDLQRARWIMRDKPIAKFWTVDDWKHLHQKLGLRFDTRIDYFRRFTPFDWHCVTT